MYLYYLLENSNLNLKLKRRVCCAYLKLYIYILWPMPLFILFYTHTMHSKSFYTQQHSYVSLKPIHIPWRDSNPGLLVPDAMSTAPLRQGYLNLHWTMTHVLIDKKCLLASLHLGSFQQNWENMHLL
jgi:hypothetical protein